MKMPAVIEAFFAADHQNGQNVLQSLFTPQAVVSDERTSHLGTDAITSWWMAAKEKYRHSTKPLDAEKRDGEHVVRGEVTGQFPGSPIVLTYRFRLDGDKIATLEIG
ncbi:nuclear transport factor 2 family protein [Rhizobium straminoryzae]|uniref:Nuclear transport factor 2 family protein n=1 Tax=Rhizobium straminoryzae TaxID=1387186 RepID=A0A549TBB4_9HYPH|nr:nuclear transport factor 2 family protein [Rhizobium straminoryzae]TRL39154.1 nuclear transport factor 2 family protein [Rhizobium straminoryzae]